MWAVSDQQFFVTREAGSGDHPSVRSLPGATGLNYRPVAIRPTTQTAQGLSKVSPGTRSLSGVSIEQYPNSRPGITEHLGGCQDPTEPV